MSQGTRKKKKKPGKHGNACGKKSIMPKNNWLAVLLLLMMMVAAVFLVMLIVVDILPPAWMLAAVFILFLFLVLARLLFTRRGIAPHIAGIAMALIFFLVYGLGIRYLTTTYAMFNKIAGATGYTTSSSGKNLTEEAFNIYITGIDQWSTEKGLDLERSDANMILTINPQTKKILLTSIPRDAYVKLHTAQQMDKLTHTGVYGVDETLNTVEDWLGIDLDHYVKMNFTAVVAIINAIGGIDVDSPVEFNPVKMPDWTVKKGMNHMDGRQALAFARERKAFEESDNARVENQQLVVEATIKKLLSSTTLLTKYGDIMEAAGDNMSTDLTTKEITSLVRMELAQPGAWDIETQKVKGEVGMEHVASLSSKNKYTVLKPDADSVAKVIGNIDTTMNPTQEEIDEAKKEASKNSITRFMNNITDRNSAEDEE